MRLRTFSGKMIDPSNLKVEDIDALDISKALSNLCRFGGHCFEFYSVAEHSLLVTKILTEWGYPENICGDIALAGLLHDASEAYICDIPTPFKRKLPQYKELEQEVMKHITAKFGIEWLNDENHEWSKPIKKADNLALDIEMDYLFYGKLDSVYPIHCYPPSKAFGLFHNTLTNLQHNG